MDANEWLRLPIQTEVSPATLDVDRWLRVAERARAPDAVRRDVAVRVPERWAGVAERSLVERSVVTAWVTSSTLVACAPGSMPDRALAQIAASQASERGARYPAPIHPAHPGDATRWTFYRRWFAHADRLDAGELRATAVCDPIAAVRAAAAFASEEARVTTTDDAVTLDVPDGSVRIDGAWQSFLALMRGYSPEQMLTAAVTAAGERLRRLTALSSRLRSAIGVEGIRFADDVPAYRMDSSVVVDPVAAVFLAGGDLAGDWPDRLAAALEPRLSTHCTCDAPRRVRASLVTGDDGRAMTLPVNDGHRLLFGVVCPHDARRPSRDEWSEAEQGLDECVQRWRETAASDEWLVGRTNVRGAAGAVVYGADAAALVADEELAPSLAAACGFAADVTLMALADNVVLAVDTADADPTIALDLGAFQQQGFPPGRPVAFSARTRAGAVGRRLRTAPLVVPG